METEHLKKPLTKDQWVFIIILCTGNWLQAIIYSLQGPFYPPEAEAKSVDSEVYGLIFGIFRLTIFIVCPILGIYIDDIGLQLTFTLGLLLNGSSAILFGLIHFIPTYTLFLSVSGILRVVEGLGAVGIKVSTFVIISIVFPGRVSTIVGFSEASRLIGISLGPILGALVFELSGFTGTFVSWGIVQVIFCLISCFLIPEIPEHKKDAVPYKVHELILGFLNIIKFPSVLLFIYSAFIAGLGTDFMNAILEPDLRQFNLLPLGVGLLFLLMGTLQIMVPVWGMILDQTDRGEFITLIGSLVTILASLLVGPFPFTSIQASIGLTAVGLLLFGLGQGATTVSSFSKIKDEVIRMNGSKEDMATISFVSSCFVSSTALGGFVGPISAGVLFFNYGFRNATLCLLALHIILVISTIVYIYKKNAKSKKPIEFIQNNHGITPQNESIESRTHNETESTPLISKI